MLGSSLEAYEIPGNYFEVQLNRPQSTNLTHNIHMFNQLNEKSAQGIIARQKASKAHENYLFCKKNATNFA